VSASAANDDGIELRDGGSVTNSGVNSHITGANGGIYADNGAAFITNQGTITGTNDFGVLLAAGGTVTNSGTAAFISGGQFGLQITGTVTAAVINRGTISGATASVRFANVNNNTLVELPGAVVVGAVQAGTGTGNVLDLGSGATTGTISGIGSQFTGFQVLHEEDGAVWQLAGANTLGAPATITLDGSAVVSVAGTLIAPSNLTVTGTGTLSTDGGGIEVGTLTAALAGQLVVDAGRTLSHAGQLRAGNVANQGSIVATGAFGAGFFWVPAAR
jgi:hypothetical protein